MERTRHLTLSDAEKQAQQEEDFRKLLKGPVQRFQDKTLSLEHLKKELGRLQEKHDVKNKDNMLRNEIADRLDLNQDNSLLLVLLRNICRADISKLESVCSGYEESIRSLSQNSIRENKDRLAQTHFISGTAVIPNLEADQRWAAEIFETREKFARMLDSEKAGIKNERRLL
jgi:putative aminopeptidase FrvX